MTYGNASAEALGEDKKVLQFYQSAILGHRKDGYTTPGDAMSVGAPVHTARPSPHTASTHALAVDTGEDV
jgi:hypothetical protein